MYPCNAGVQPDALAAAREVFCGGQIGKACGPKHWFHLMVRHVGASNGVKPDAATGCATLHFTTTAASSAELDRDLVAFGQQLDADPACFSPSYAARMKGALKKAVVKDFEDVFVPWFDDLKKAKLVPPKLRSGKPKRAAKVAAMWRLLGSPWPTVSVKIGSNNVSVQTLIGMPFLSDTLLGWIAMSRMGNWRDAAKSASHVFPQERAWGKSWASLPAGKLKGC